MTSSSITPLLDTLSGGARSPSPWWLMRQAGRYLPEYREVRGRAADFIKLCLTPALATELTLQPVRRFGMDGAIVFSDILLLPYALGQGLAYRDREGPVLDPIANAADIARLRPTGAVSRLDPVLETLRRVRVALEPETALIGFAGAPWTVATYMVEGGSSRDFRRVKGWAYADPQGFATLIDLLTRLTIDLLVAELAAGAQVVQLFDTWCGALAEAEFARWVIAPTRRIVTGVKERFPASPIIGFPRAAGVLYKRYVVETGIDAVGLDTSVPLEYARSELAPYAVLQGNLDPVALLTGGTALEEAVSNLRRTLGGCRWVFNLGHGVLPQTPPDNVAVLARMLREPETGG